MTSTASDTLRCPALASRTSMRSGVRTAGSMPRTSRSTNRSQAVGSSMLAGQTSSEIRFTYGGRPASAGSVYAAP